MGRKAVTRVLLAAVAGLVLFIPSVVGASQGSEWNYAGGNRQNTRYQQAEKKLSTSNIGSLAVKWRLTTGGDVSATPAVDATTVYVPDWAGNLYAVDKFTGVVKWQANLPSVTGVPSDKARATPAVTDTTIIVGTQGNLFAGFAGQPLGGARVLAFDKFTGALLWSTQADTHPAAIITQSATVFDGLVYVGVASQEEILSIVQGYQCCSFRGSMLAIDAATGAIVWKTYMVPDGYSGGSVWGSSPAIDTKRGQVYVATGNNYSVPQGVLDCVAASPGNSACVAADDLFDSVVALDIKTGAIRWATRAVPFDAWVADCIPFLGDGSNCPDPAGPDFDFGQAPALFTVMARKGKPIDVVGAGQKSGQYWALKADTGAVLWVTQAGPGGTAGGLQWGSAVDGTRVYTANANSNLVPWPGPGGDTSGVWSGLDAATGAILWQTRPPDAGSTSGPVTTANGLVFGCSLDPTGHMYALSAATGQVLWSFESGGSCLSGAAISDGMVFWGSGYSNLGFGTPSNKLYAFGLPG